MTEQQQRRSIKCDLVLESAIVQHETGTLWCLNMLIWSLALAIGVIWAVGRGAPDVYRVPGVTRAAAAPRVWNRPAAAFAVLPALTESGVQLPVLDDHHVPEFIRGFQVEERTQGVELDVD